MIDSEILISEETLKGYELLRDDSGLVELTHFSLITLSGEDRKGWLQGQATNDLRKLDAGASSLFCFTAITGHLISVCEAWAISDRFAMTCPRSTVDNVLKRVEQMVILEDVLAEDVSNAFRLLSIQGPTATARLSQFVTLPNLDAGESTLNGVPVYVLRSNRTGLGGWDLWVPREETGVVATLASEFKSVDFAAYDIARLEAGIPMFGSDMTEKTFPPEMGRTFEERHVSYNKGCYVGQEVLMRIHSRGHTNRTWVSLLSDGPFAAGSVVSHDRRSDAGLVTSALFSPDYGHIGAAMLRNDFAFEGEIVQVQTARGPVDAEVRLMPILR